MGRKERCKMFRHTNRPVNNEWADFPESSAMLTLHLDHRHHGDYMIFSPTNMAQVEITYIENVL